MKKLFCLFLVFTVLIPDLLPAESKLNDWNRIKILKRGTEVSIKQIDGSTSTGTIADHWSNGITLFVNQRVLQVARENVLLVWKPRKLNRGLTILIGAGMGTFAGYGVGKSLENEATREEDPGLLPIMGSLTGCVIGATVGLLIAFSKSDPEDKLIYRAPLETELPDD